MRNVLICVVLVACGGAPKPATESPPPASSSLLDCARIADHVATSVAADRPRAGATPAAIKDMVATRCRTDGWSDETKQCLHATKTIREARACAAGMTDVQREAIKAHARKLRQANDATEDDHSADWIKHVVEEPSS
jgi:hypothetical protein